MSSHHDSNPHTEESRRAERLFLVKCFADPTGCVTAIESSGLEVTEFLGVDHRYILEAILAGRAENRTDAEAVIWRLNSIGRLDDAGGKQTLLDMAREAATNQDVLNRTPGELLGKVRNLAGIRHLQRLLSEQQAKLNGNPDEIDAARMGHDTAEELYRGNQRRVVIHGTSLRTGGGFRNVAQDLAAEVNRPEAMPEGAIPTGFNKLDLGMGGILKRGRSLLFLGPPDAGKTTLVGRFFIHAGLHLKRTGAAAAVTFQEGSANEYMRRLVQMHAAVKSGAVPRPETLTQAGEELDGCRLFIDDGEWTADKIAPHLARLKEQGAVLYMHESAELMKTPGVPSNSADPLDGLEYKLHRMKTAAYSNHIATVLTASIQVATVAEVIEKLAGRQRLADVAMVLLPQAESAGKPADPHARELVVFHNHLGPLGRLSLRLRPDLGGILEVDAPGR